MNTEKFIKQVREEYQLPIKKGEAIIWASNLIHGGSLPQNPALTRMSQVTHFFFEGAEFYYTPLLSDPVNGKWTKRDVEALRIR